MTSTPKVRKGRPPKAKTKTANTTTESEKLPPNVAIWVLPENLVRLEGWARDGLNRNQISHNMGISHATLDAWKKKYEKIGKALRIGREVLIYTLENMLITKARNGDLGAIIFALKNYAPHKWRDRHEVFNGGAENVKPVKIVLQYKDGRVNNEKPET